MKEDEYKKEVLGRLDGENQTTCEDCGRKDKIGHAIIDHDTDKIKMVCHDCFVSKYEDFVYPENKGRTPLQ